MQKLAKKKPKIKSIVTIKRENFVENYVKSYNLSEAAKLSGYSYTQAKKILNAPEMQAYLNKKRKEYEADSKNLLLKIKHLALIRTAEVLSSSLTKNSEPTALAMAFRAAGLLAEKTQLQTKKEDEELKERRRKWIAEIRKRAKK